MDLYDMIFGRQQQPPAPKPPYSPLDTSTPAVISQARQQYPFMAGQVLVPTTKQGGEGWPVGETGDAAYPRPTSIPLNQPGAEIGPGSTPGDVAGEAFHSDPVVNQHRDKLLKSLSPAQVTYLQRQSRDYQDSVGQGQESAMRNAGDSVIRGALFNQWPQEALHGMNFTPDQMGILQNLSQYMRTPPTTKDYVKKIMENARGTSAQ
jgi:hypothetical protein